MFYFRNLLLISLMSSCTQTAVCCDPTHQLYELENSSPVFQYSTDTRLMLGIKKLGELGNGMVVYTWFWNNEAKKMGPRYNDPDFGGVLAVSSLTAVGLLTKDVKKIYPNAVSARADGYEYIDEKVLMQEDKFIRHLVEARSSNGSKSCTRVIDTKFSFCF